ncbi:MAG: hypothetical protein IKS49_04150 [Actinomycetaceae bacterium]|nr:hypothetical protein [Actinomycetaceae bacterium]
MSEDMNKAHSRESDGSRKTTWESASSRRGKRPAQRAGKNDGRREDYRDGRRQGRSSERRWEDRDSSRETSRGNKREYRKDKQSWRDDRRGGNRDDRRGGYRDDRRDGYRDDYRGERRGRRGDRRENYRDDYRNSKREYGRSRDEYEGRPRGRRDDTVKRPRDPQIPEFVSAKDLDGDARAHLRSLSKDNADRVARHLVYAGSMMDENPELAYEHAQAAYRHAARIDIVREALGLTSYLTGRYSQALRELRTYRRMTDDYSHVAIEADSERGLGRAEKALRFIDEIPLKKLDNESLVELALVKSGARADIGDSAGGLEVIERIKVDKLDTLLRARIELIRADRYEELGRAEEAAQLREKWEPIFDENGEVDFYEEDVDVSAFVPDAASSDDGSGGESSDSGESAPSAPTPEPSDEGEKD